MILEVVPMHVKIIVIHMYLNLSSLYKIIATKPTNFVKCILRNIYTPPCHLTASFLQRHHRPSNKFRKPFLTEKENGRCGMYCMGGEAKVIGFHAFFHLVNFKMANTI